MKHALFQDHRLHSHTLKALLEENRPSVFSSIVVVVIALVVIKVRVATVVVEATVVAAEVEVVVVAALVVN